ncbi:MAG: hypothetical protein RMK20_07585, partial [Verrucomicrobiales bacterium]|nr:hypothetical protein [Verrucomicrobiales bacterium]
MSNGAGGDQWCAGIFWPLGQTGLFLNEAVLTADPRTFQRVRLEDDEILDALNKHGQAFNNYWDYFLLCDRHAPPWSEPLAKSSASGPKEPSPTTWSTAADALSRQFNTLKGEAKWLQLLGSLPQHKCLKKLLLGADAGITKVGKDAFVESSFVTGWQETCGGQSLLEQFYAFTEIESSRHLTEGEARLPELLELRDIVRAKRLLLTGNESLSDVQCLAVRSSFFADGITDVVFVVFLGSKNSHQDNLAQTLGGGFQGVAYSLRRRRQAWLQDWIQRLKQRVVEVARENATGGKAKEARKRAAK